jgi:tetratricopeptide (TPR) repeat protein
VTPPRAASSNDEARPRSTIAIAAPRWERHRKSREAEEALSLAHCLAFAHQGLGQYDEAARYADWSILIAEATDQPLALSRALRQMAVRFVAVGAPNTALTLYRASADIARSLGLQDPLAGALTGQLTILFTRDLDAALTISRESIEAARRGGTRSSIETAITNLLLVLWTAGRLDEVRDLLASLPDDAQDPSIGLFVLGISRWLDDSVGQSSEHRTGPAVTEDEAGDNRYTLAWLGHTRMVDALDRGDTAEAARLAEQTLPLVLAAFGIEDEFVFHWPPLVMAALANNDPDLADRLMEPVTTTRAALPPYLDAQRLSLSGLIGATRGDDPGTVEADLRAGAAGLAAFGAVGDAARAEVELARWLIAQDRAAEAVPLLGHARATYDQIGALGWLAQMDAEVSTRS